MWFRLSSILRPRDNPLCICYFCTNDFNDPRAYNISISVFFLKEEDLREAKGPFEKKSPSSSSRVSFYNTKCALRVVAIVFDLFLQPPSLDFTTCRLFVIPDHCS